MAPAGTLVVEMLDANQNVIVGGVPGTFTLSQAGGSLPPGR